MNENSWGLFNKAELISFLESVTFLIGVTEKRAYYIESVKREINFSEEDYQGEYYNRISKAGLDVLLMYVREFKGSKADELRRYLLELLSCDSESPITKIGFNKIINLTKVL